MNKKEQESTEFTRINNDISLENHSNIIKKISLEFMRYLNSVLELPDKKVGWLIPAVWKGFWIIKNEDIKIIFTTSPPETTAVVGLILSKLTHAKLVTDLRDPWNFHDEKPLMSRTRLSDAIETWLSKSITHNSDKLISATEHYTEFLRAQYPNLPKDKFCTIWNGFDKTDFNFEGIDKESNIFVMSYLGTFYYGRTPREFLCALGKLVKEEVIPKDKIRINFIGDVSYAEGVFIEDLIKMNDLNGCVILSQRIPYKEALAQMLRSDVLLLFAPEQYYCIPAKAFEYLGANKHILCFAKEGATADLIRETRRGIVVDPYDVYEIKSAIKNLYLSWRLKKELNCEFDTHKFERRELTCRLAAILQDISIP
jgi:glycosyltransferase involved in cell wall biosynthesis